MIEVMTFSIMGSKKQQAGEVSHAGKPGEPGWDVRKNITLKFLLANRFDFFSFQHCYYSSSGGDWDAVGFFKEALSCYGLQYGVIARAHGKNIERGDATPLFFDEKRWICLDQGYSNFKTVPPVGSSGGGSLFSFGVFQDRNRHHSEPALIAVYSTRFKNKLSAELDRYRAQCFAEILAHMNSLRDDVKFFIFLGDTNCKDVGGVCDRLLLGDRDSWLRLGLEDVFLKDAFIDVHPDLHGKVSTQHGFKTPGDISGSERNDRILVSKNFSVTRCEISTVNEQGWYPSYHYPVIATLMISDG